MRNSSLRPTGLAVSVAIFVATPALASVNLKLQRSASEAGRSKVCVSMSAPGVDVAGTQNDIRFDPSCADLTKADCVASAHHKKPLHGSIPDSDPSTFRSLVFALDNVDAMPDGEVYCCNFKLTSKGDGCCAAEMDRLGASDPTGVALEVKADPGKVCLAGDGAVPAAAPAAQDAQPARAAGTPTPGWLWVALLACVVLGALFFALRKSD